MMIKIAEWLRKRKIYNNTYNELNRLTNHELADLGMNRSMIGEIARKAAYGKEENV